MLNKRDSDVRIKVQTLMSLHSFLGDFGWVFARPGDGWDGRQMLVSAGILKRRPGCLQCQCSGSAQTPFIRAGVCSRLPSLGQFWHCRQQDQSLCIHLTHEMTFFNSRRFLCSDPLFNIHPTSSVTTPGLLISSPLSFLLTPPYTHTHTSYTHTHTHTHTLHTAPFWFLFLKCPKMINNNNDDNNNDSKKTTIKTPKKALHVM